jgi:hypothetical protein
MDFCHQTFSSKDMLFMVYLMMRSVSWLMNWKIQRRKRLWPNLGCCPGICLERLKKTMKTLSQSSYLPGHDLNPRLSEQSSKVNHLSTTFNNTKDIQRPLNNEVERGLNLIWREQKKNVLRKKWEKCLCFNRFI